MAPAESFTWRPLGNLRNRPIYIYLRLETVQKGYDIAAEGTDTALREHLEHLPIGRFGGGGVCKPV